MNAGWRISIKSSPTAFASTFAGNLAGKTLDLFRVAFQLQAKGISPKPSFHLLHRPAEDHATFVHHAHVAANLIDVTQNVT